MFVERFPRREGSESSLLPARMRLALSGKHRVGPFILLLGRSYRGGRRLRLDSPVRRRGMNAPDIRLLFQRESHQPIITPGSQRNTVSNPSQRAGSARKFVERNWHPRLQWPRKADAASLRVYDESMALLAEWNGRIETGNAKRNLRPNSGTAPRRFKRFRTRAHRRTLFDCTSRRKLLACLRRRVETKVTSKRRDIFRRLSFRAKRGICSRLSRKNSILDRPLGASSF
jgi:hypothetical protein